MFLSRAQEQDQYSPAEMVIPAGRDKIEEPRRSDPRENRDGYCRATLAFLPRPMAKSIPDMPSELVETFDTAIRALFLELSGRGGGQPVGPRYSFCSHLMGLCDAVGLQRHYHPENSRSGRSKCYSRDWSQRRRVIRSIARVQAAHRAALCCVQVARLSRPSRCVPGMPDLARRV